MYKDEAYYMHMCMHMHTTHVHHVHVHVHHMSCTALATTDVTCINVKDVDSETNIVC